MLTTKPALRTLELVDMPAAVTDQAVAHVPTLTTLQVSACVRAYSGSVCGSVQWAVPAHGLGRRAPSHSCCDPRGKAGARVKASRAHPVRAAYPAFQALGGVEGVRTGRESSEGRVLILS